MSISQYVYNKFFYTKFFAHRENRQMILSVIAGCSMVYRVDSNEKNVTGDSENNQAGKSLLMKSKTGVLKRKMRTCARLFCNYQLPISLCSTLQVEEL